MSSTQSGEGEIRTNTVKADVVDCMIALPGQLFYSTPIPACLWFLTRNKRNGGLRDRRGEVLFMDARQLGHLVDRTRRELSDEDIERISNTYHAPGGDMTTDLRLIRSGNEQGLLLGEWSDWRGYRDLRAKTSHTYDEGTALAVVTGIPGFLEEARYLRDRLRERLA